MGRVIDQNASAEAKLGDVRITLELAASRGAPFHDPAETFLRAVANDAEAVRLSLIQNRKDRGRVVAEQTAQVLRCHDLVGKWHDELYNLAGRPADDPILQAIYPGGFRVHLPRTVSKLPDALRVHAMLVEKNVHPLIPVNVVQELAEALRGEAATTDDLADRIGPIDSEATVLRRQLQTIAQRGQLQLVSLKRYLQAMHVTEAEIHLVIPSRARRGPGAESAVAAPSAEGTARAVGITLVPAVEDPVAEAVADEQAA